MGVIVDMILAIAMVAVATGAVTELQLRIGHIGAAADGAFVVKILSFRSRTELDRLAGLLLCRLALFDNAHLPGHQIPHILAGKQQEVQKTHQGEQVVRENEEIIDDRNGDQYQIQKADQPGLYGNDKENQKLCIGVSDSKHQNNAQVQI